MNKHEIITLWVREYYPDLSIKYKDPEYVIIGRQTDVDNVNSSSYIIEVDFDRDGTIDWFYLPHTVFDGTGPTVTVSIADPDYFPKLAALIEKAFNPLTPLTKVPH